MTSRWALPCGLLAAFSAALPSLAASYTNFEVSHVHPIDLTPSGGRLLAVNTPDALLEVFTVAPDGSLTPEAAIPVGLEPVTVVARTEGEAWVVNNLSDSVSIIDLTQKVIVKTLAVGDEPTDVAFAGSRAFVAVSQEDAVKVFDLANLDAAPAVVALPGRDVRALAVSGDSTKVYAVVLRSGNGTTVVSANILFGDHDANLNNPMLQTLGLRDLECASPGPPLYPPLPPGIARNPALDDPPPSSNPVQFPPVGLIVRWDEVLGQWRDEAGQSWNHCLPYTLGDHDLFVIDATSLGVTAVDGLGTSMLDVAVHPTSGRIYVPHTEARNFVRFEHPLGVGGHVVNDRLAIVDPASPNAVTLVDLNAHIDRESDPATNLAERLASISQPGMLVWRSDGSRAYLTAIGSRKIFRVDGSCLTAACIFGANRAAPEVAVVGEGPTGVALREAPQAADERLYVLNRISHTISIVAPAALKQLDEIPLHDPSSNATRLGRRFLYDAIDTSGHGDAACSSCHLSGDMDGLAWDLGNPEGVLAPYAAAEDNVRFIIPQNGEPTPCEQFCTTHDGFDPQKGPMVTQTLRGMLEPLHWRGDRPTVRAFNPAFVELLGAEDIGPIDGKPAGLTAEAIEQFRQFALEMRFPPNPYRKVDDTTSCGLRAVDPVCEVQVHGSLFPGNPTEGARIFVEELIDGGQPCVACHASSFGTAGGQLGGVEPEQPTSTVAAALLFGTADASPHSDLKVAHLRNLYDKFGPVWAAPGNGSMPETKTGFGFTHDGSLPDLFRFLSTNVFVYQGATQAKKAEKLRDVASFMSHFPTGTAPAVGRQVTLPAGAPPTGSAGAEALLVQLVALGDLADGARHCELVATTIASSRPRRYHLSGGSWVTNVAAEPPVTTLQLRQGASAPITFTCVTLGAGPRLGGDRDEDARLDGDDCAPADADTLAAPLTVSDLTLQRQGTIVLDWSDQGATAGPSVRYDVLGGELSALRTSGIAATTCIAPDLTSATHVDASGDPPPGEGVYYWIRVENPCGTASLGPGLEELEQLECPVP